MELDVLAALVVVAEMPGHLCATYVFPVLGGLLLLLEQRFDVLKEIDREVQLPGERSHFGVHTVRRVR